MDVKGLHIKGEEGNVVRIDPDCSFLLSRIYISGKNNVVELGKSRVYDKLFINIKGDNKKIKISNSNKNICNLKIVSIRSCHQSVIIGSNFSCGGCEIQMNDGNESLAIGNNCLFSWGIKIRTSDGHAIIDIETGKPLNLPRDVIIGEHVWIGEDVKILKGSIVPADSVVGSGAIVTKAFGSEDQNTIIAGVPARVVRRGIKWDHKMARYFL